MTKLFTVMAVVLASCAIDTDEDPDDTSTVEQDILPPSGVSSYCTFSGGYNWCQDWYTKKWCTNSYTARGWDLTYCDWSGWSSNGNYCGNPTYYPNHEWAQDHTHCD